jgi:hypothetical protein
VTSYVQEWSDDDHGDDDDDDGGDDDCSSNYNKIRSCIC